MGGKQWFNLKSLQGKVLDVHGGLAEKGSSTCIWPANGGDNQVWAIEPTN